MDVNGRKLSVQQMLQACIAVVGAEVERSTDPIKQMALLNAVGRLTEALWWVEASTTAGNMVSMP